MWQVPMCDPWPSGWAEVLMSGGGAELGRCPSHSETLCWLPGVYHSFALIFQAGEDGQTQASRPWGVEALLQITTCLL